jgi:hypothetical protein
MNIHRRHTFLAAALLLGAALALPGALSAARHRRTAVTVASKPVHDSAAAVEQARRYMIRLHRPIIPLNVDTSRVRVLQSRRPDTFSVELFRSFPEQEGFLILMAPASAGLGGDALMWVDDDGTVKLIKVWG